MNFNLHNSYKLITKEDPIHIHKLLGGICLAHYIYRYYLLLSTGTMSLRTPVAYYMVGIHGLLSCSSMIFHIPNQRIKGGPMIYPEYRLHSIVFALRSVACYYVTYHGFPKIYNVGICVATMGLADIITYMYPSGTTTMRQMPFESGVDPTKRKYIIMMQSFHQIGATFYMLGNEDACFSPMFAIQLAALLMTLVRKSIISTNMWHFIYNISLGINIFAYWTLPIQFIFMQLALSHLFFYWRCYLSRETPKDTVTTDAPLSYDGKPSPDNPDGVSGRHQETTALPANHRTPTLSSTVMPHSPTKLLTSSYFVITSLVREYCNSGVLPNDATAKKKMAIIKEIIKEIRIGNKYIGWIIVFSIYLWYKNDSLCMIPFYNGYVVVQNVLIIAYCINHTRILLPLL